MDSRGTISSRASPWISVDRATDGPIHISRSRQPRLPETRLHYAEPIPCPKVGNSSHMKYADLPLDSALNQDRTSEVNRRLMVAIRIDSG